MFVTFLVWLLTDLKNFFSHQDLKGAGKPIMITKTSFWLNVIPSVYHCTCITSDDKSCDWREKVKITFFSSFLLG